MSIESSEQEQKQFLISNTLKRFDLARMQKLLLNTRAIEATISDTDLLLEHINKDTRIIQKDKKVAPRLSGTIEQFDTKINIVVEKLVQDDLLNLQEQEFLFRAFQENEQRRLFLFNLQQQPSAISTMFPFFRLASMIDQAKTTSGGIALGAVKLGNMAISVLKGGAAAWVVCNVVLTPASVALLLGSESVFAGMVLNKTFINSATYFVYGVFSSKESMRRRIFSGGKFATTSIAGDFSGVLVNHLGGGVLGTILGKSILQFTSGTVVGTLEARLFPGNQKDQLVANTLLQKQKREMYHREVVKQLEAGVSVQQLRNSKRLKLKMFLLNQNDTTKAMLFLGMAAFSTAGVIAAWNSLGIVPISLGFVLDKFNLKNALYYNFLAPVIMAVIQMSGIAQIISSILLASMKKVGKLVLSKEQEQAIRDALMKELVFNICLGKILERFGNTIINVSVQTAVTQPDLYINKIAEFMESQRGNVESLAAFAAGAFSYADAEIVRELQRDIVPNPIDSKYDQLFETISDDIASPAIEMQHIQFAGRVAKLSQIRDNLFSDLEGMQMGFRQIAENRKLYSEIPKVTQKIDIVQKEFETTFQIAQRIENDIANIESKLESITQEIADTAIDSETATKLSEQMSAVELKQASTLLSELRMQILRLQKTQGDLDNSRWKYFSINKTSLLNRIEALDFSKQQSQLLDSLYQKVRQSNDPEFVQQMESVVERIGVNVASLKTLQANQEIVRDRFNWSNTALELLDSRLSADELAKIGQLEANAKVLSAQYSNRVSTIEAQIVQMESSVQAIIADGRVSNEEVELFLRDQRTIREEFNNMFAFQRDQAKRVTQYQNALYSLFTERVVVPGAADPTTIDKQTIENRIVSMLLSRVDKLLPFLNSDTLSKYNLNSIAGMFAQAQIQQQSPSFDISEFSGINRFVSDVARLLDNDAAVMFVDAIDNLLKNSNPTDGVRSVAGIVPLASGSAALGGGIGTFLFPGTTVLGATAKTISGLAGISGIGGFFARNIIPNTITSETVLSLFNEEIDKVIFSTANTLRGGVPTFDRSIVTVLAFQDGLSSTVLKSIFSGELVTALQSGIESSSAFSMMFWGDQLAPRIRNFFGGVDPAASALSGTIGLVSSIVSLMATPEPAT